MTRRLKFAPPPPHDHHRWHSAGYDADGAEWLACSGCTATAPALSRPGWRAPERVPELRPSPDDWGVA